MEPTITRHLLISGRVQRVGYRNYIVYKAGVHGVRGWVRNLADGRVEAMIEGTPAAVTALIECAQRGPRLAEVTGVEVTESLDTFTNFAVLETK